MRPIAVDGTRLVEEVVEFSRELRAAGLSADLRAVLDFVRALGLVDIGDATQVHAAGAAIYTHSREQRAIYDAVFARFWRERFGNRTGLPPAAAPSRPGERPRAKATMRPDADRLRRDAATSRGGDAGAPDALQATAPRDAAFLVAHAYSRERVDRHRLFERMTAAELREAERFVDLLSPRLELRRTRRHELHRRGRLAAPRAMLRRAIASGGEQVEWLWRRRVRRPRPLVVLCDVSGSMERDSRILLRFAQALAASDVRTEAFVFGTRLTRVTRLLRDRDRNRALARVAEATTDWSGGTRIGECLRDFNRRWARRVMTGSSNVVVVSDGWDRGDVDLLGRELARLRRSCHRLIWLNPLASADGYEPVAAGMAAALPHVDDFLAAGSLASLERLAVLLASHGSPRR